MRSSDDGELGWLLRDLAHAPVASNASVPDVAFTDEGVAITSAEPRLTAGTLLGGRFAIIELLGRGGMGEVYRARDRRLDRDVAIKLLTDGDEGRRTRFEVEARAASAIRHENVLAIHDVSAHEGMPFLVLELVDGITLRARLASGGLPVQRAIAIAIQICDGLAAAHAARVIHRDLKPENLVITRDERIKIVDFGLAKRARATGEALDASLTVDGALIGTVAYMSPEQARGEDVDHRSDLFALGAIVVEMVTGRPAFRGVTTADTLSAILRDEPALDGLPDELGRVARRCLAKSPAARFQSATDLAFALDSVIVRPVRRRALPRYAPHAMIAVGALVAGAGVMSLRGGDATVATVEPAFARLTFGRGLVHAARYAPDEKTVVYSAAWNGNEPGVYTTEPGVFESRPLSPMTELLAVASSRELLLKRTITERSVWGFWTVGTMVRGPLAGGTQRDIAVGVSEADIAADGTLAIVRVRDGVWRIEWPIGHVVYEATGWIGQPRFSPDGSQLAFLAHPRPEDDGGTVDVVDVTGKHRVLTRALYLSIQGLAWSPDGRDVLFTGTTRGATRELRAITLAGEERLVYRAPTTLRILDVAPDGRLLLARDENRVRMTAIEGDGTERDLAWLDGSSISSFSGDDSLISFTESWDGAGTRYGCYVRPYIGGDAVRVADGNASRLSHRPPWQVLITEESTLPGTPRTLWRAPIGEGTPTAIDIGGLDVMWASWMPDDASVLLVLADRELARVPIAGGIPERLGVKVSDIFNIAVDPRGTRAAIVVDGAPVLFDFSTRATSPIPNARAAERPNGFSADGAVLVVTDLGQIPATFTAIELASGERTTRSIRPPDRAGASAITSFLVSHDLSKVIYSYLQTLSTAYEARLPR